MKIKYLLTIISITIIVQTGIAQKTTTDANVIGDVQCNGEHVPFINIAIDGTTIGTVTDATGHYQITDMPIGTFTIRASGIGYKSTSQSVTTSVNTTTEIKFVVKEDMLNIEGVIISADRNHTNRAEAPVVVTSIASKVFANTQSVNIAEGLGFSPGLRTECNCQNCGFTQLRMNGLDGPYTQILMNSRPVFSGLAGVYGLELIPANMVERLEVIRGGGSALFGGNAIAGTVNIITKEPTMNTYSIDGRIGMIGIRDYEGTNPAIDAQLNVNASVVSDDSRTGAYVYAMLRDRDAYDENGDKFSESVLIENTTFGFSMYYKPGVKSKFSLDGYRISEFRRGGNKLDCLPHEADIAEQIEHIVTGANLAYDLFINNNYDKFTIYAAAQKIKRDTYYGSQQDQNAYGNTNDITSSIGAQYILNTKKLFFAASSTVFGIDNNNNYIHDVKLGTLGDTNTTLTHQVVNTIGVFAQHDWKSKKLNLSLGLRYDNYYIVDFGYNEDEISSDVSKGVFAPRLSLLYKITPNIRFRAGYAKGYRAPQVFNEDFHIELVSAKQVFHINDENLTQETSHSLTTSLNFNLDIGSTANDFLFEVFYTKLNNAFADEYYQVDDEGSWAYLRVNASDGAYVSGANFEYNIQYEHKLEVKMGFSLQKSQFIKAQKWGEEDESTSRNFIRSPDKYGYAIFNCHITNHFNTVFSLNYTGSMYVPHFGSSPTSASELQQLLAEDRYEEYNQAININSAIVNGDIIEGEQLEKTEDFLVVDLLLNYDFNLGKVTKLRLYAGVKNIFNQKQEFHDRGVYRDAGYIYGPCQPRTINLGLKIGNFL